MAFSIVRIINLTTSSMQVLFTDDIDIDVGISNISISAAFDSVPDPEIISLSIENDIITISFRPLFSHVQYKVTFFSVGNVKFKSINGEIISEDGNRNVIFITSPGEETNTYRDVMIEELPSIYNSDEGSLIRKLITCNADQFQQVGDAIETTKSGNYLSKGRPSSNSERS